MERFFALSEAEKQRLRELQDDPESPYYRKLMSEIMRAVKP